MVEHQDRWWGRHRGCIWSVHRTDRPYMAQFGDSTDAWCFYVTLTEQQFDVDTWAKICPEPKERQYRPGDRIHADYNYYDIPIIGDLPWHGGITFFERCFDQFGKPTAIKAGCDYQHLWDDGMEYDIDMVSRDAMHCIDALIDAYPALMVWRVQDGKYEPLVDQERKSLESQENVTATNELSGDCNQAHRVDLKENKGVNHESS